MKKLFLLLLLFFSYTISFAQLENANWHFGQSTGLTFNTTPPSVISSQLGSFPHHGYSGCSSSVSDTSGNVLFYTDGVLVWDKNHNIMTHGTDLYGAVSQIEGKQNSVIVPKPGNSNIYYIFTISYFEPGWTTIGHGGLHYSVVDMSLRFGLGDVVTGLKNIPLTSHDNVALDYDYSTATGLQSYQTKITTTLSATGNKIWLSFFPYFYQGGVSSLYSYSYAITENGICGQADGSSPVPTSYDLLSNANYDPWPYITAGCIKISPDGQHLAEIADHHVNLYDFNNATGHVTFDTTLYNATLTDPYPAFGLEFSPNSQLVYFSAQDSVYQTDHFSFGGGGSRTRYARIFQCPVSKGEKKQIGAFPIDVASNNVITPLPAVFPMGMQLGIDNKIYVCTHDFNGVGYTPKWLGVIQDPDQFLTPTFVAQSIDLSPYTHWGGLPQWVYTAKIEWPKVYDALEPAECVKTDDHGNVLARINLHNMANNVNHNGPVVPNTLYDFWMQYNKSDAATNWVAQESYFQNFTMSSGDLHLSQGAQSMAANKYRNATTGTVISGPSYVPTSDLIVAEDNGIYITSHLDNNTPVDELVVNASPSIHNAVAMPTLSGHWVGTNRIIFNPATNNLFVDYSFYPFFGSTMRDFLAVYHLDNTTYTLSSTPLYYRELTDPLAEVNSQEEAFVFHSGVIKKYDYVNDTYTTLAVSNNSSLYTFRTLKQTVEDNIVAINFTDSKIYCFNTNPLVMTTRKLSASLGSDNIDPYIGCYHVDGDYVYLAGGFSGSSFTIGNQISTQTMPLLGSLSSFITRFHIIEDFNRSIGLGTGFFAKPAEPQPLPQEKATFSATLFPNPAKNTLEVKLTESNAKAVQAYTIDIVNIYGVTQIRKNAQRDKETVNISTLKTGVYYMVITNMKGETIKKAFIKE